MIYSKRIFVFLAWPEATPSRENAAAGGGDCALLSNGHPLDEIPKWMTSANNVMICMYVCM